MATLDRIIEMQQKGIGEAAISKQLQDEGVAPQEINDSLNQAKIKTAVSQNPQNPQQPPQLPQPPPLTPGQTQEIPQQTQEATQPAQSMPQEQMQQSIAQTEPAPQPAATLPEPPPVGVQQQYPPEQAPQQEYQEYYPEQPQAYQQDAYYPQTAGLDTDTISEIAEQVVQEKFAEFEKRTGDLAAFRNEMQEKVTDLFERLKRIENSIDKLQQAVIGKVSEFSETTQEIHKDLDALHNTTSKLMNPLIDNYKELKKIAKGK